MDTNITSSDAELSLTLGSHLMALGRKVGIPELTLDEQGACIMSFDEHVVTFQEEDEGRGVTMYTVLGILPRETAAGVYRNVLSGNLFWAETHGATLALEDSTDSLVLAREVDVSKMSEDEFQDLLGLFLDAADWWRDHYQDDDDVEKVDPMSLGAMASMA